MNPVSRCRSLPVGLALCLLLSGNVFAQEKSRPAEAVVQTTGTLGSPSATTTLPGNQLPPPAPEFGGVIKDDALQSTPWWPPRIVPPKDAPNILMIMTDDAGFAIPSTFGGVIPDAGDGRAGGGRPALSTA